MRHPPLRIVPPGPAQLAADPAAPATCYFAAPAELIALATAACGLGVELGAEVHVVRGSHVALQRLAAELDVREPALALHLRHALAPEPSWRLRTRSLPLDRPLVMGILNLTEDSFSGDGVGRDLDRARRQAAALREAGADIIDVGAESARADRPVLDAGEEAELIGRVVGALVGDGHLVSSDTYKPVVARAALEAGAEIVNDISGLTQGLGAAEEAARAGAGYVLNYSYTVPKRRPDAPPQYEDVVTETLAWMVERVAWLEEAGHVRAQIAIDPGIAFGKSHAEDIAALRRLGELRTVGLPLLLAHSRKNFIGSITGRPPGERDFETHVASALAFERGARIVRVHDVAGARRALDFAHALLLEPLATFAPDATSWPWRAGASASHMTTAAPDRPAPPGQRW